MVTIHDGGHYCSFPCGQRPGTQCNVPLRPHMPTGWSWDGNTVEPTITPSIECGNAGCGLHITITKGKIV